MADQGFMGNLDTWFTCCRIVFKGKQPVFAKCVQNLLQSRAVSVVPPPYLVTATTDQSAYNQGELVLISGVATTTADGSPAANDRASIRAGTSAAELAWRVPHPPPWPVLRAASRSTTSAPAPPRPRAGRVASAAPAARASGA